MKVTEADMKEVSVLKDTMTIKELAAFLQKRIDIRMKSFMENYDKLKVINKEIEELEKKMVTVIEELEPVQSLIYSQNPHLEKVFESLKRVYGKEENERSETGFTINREAH
jgi:50S ribosomal subunit-associated GTPase HflX